MRRRGLCLILVLAAGTILGSGGCSVGPKYKPPIVPLPQSWRIPVSESASLANEKWWTLFQDPVLHQLIEIALKHNTDIQLAAAQVLQAQAQVTVTRSSELPQVSANPSIARERLSRNGSFALPPGFSQTFNLATLSGSASYLVDFWGEYRRATEEAKQSLLATEQARRNVIIGVVSSVAQGYFRLRALDLELKDTNDTVAASRDSLKLTQELFKGGVASELDTKQAEIALDTALAEIPALQQQIGQQEDALSILLGINPSNIPRGFDISKQPLPPEVPAGLPSQLLKRRPDIVEADRAIAAEFAAVGVAKAQFFPQLSLTASGGVESTVLAKIISFPALVWSASAGLTAPIFSGGRLRGNLKIAKAQLQQAEINYQAAVLQAFREVNDALIAYKRSQEAVGAQEALVTAEQGALHLANLRYKAGVDTYLNVLTAEQSLFTGEITLAQGRASVLIALVQLYQALGGGWQP